MNASKISFQNVELFQLKRYIFSSLKLIERMKLIYQMDRKSNVDSLQFKQLFDFFATNRIRHQYWEERLQSNLLFHLQKLGILYRYSNDKEYLNGIEEKLYQELSKLQDSWSRAVLN